MSRPRRSPVRSTPDSEHVALPPHLQHLNLNAAAVDVGPPATSSARRLAVIRPMCGSSPPFFGILEERGLSVLLVDARHVKHVSGRKSDVLDCQWLQQLHTYGLLQGAFRPAEEIAVLRSYLRQRATLIRYAAAHVQHMQKALQQMNALPSARHAAPDGIPTSTVQP